MEAVWGDNSKKPADADDESYESAGHEQSADSITSKIDETRTTSPLREAELRIRQQQADHGHVTQAAYTRRLQKVSLAIRNVLNTPDIVTPEECENQSVANDIANQINTDAGVPNLYTTYSTDNSTFFTQDGTGISVGFR